MSFAFDVKTLLLLTYLSWYQISRCTEAEYQAAIPRMLQCGIVLTLTLSKTIPCIAPLSAADGSPAVCELRPEEAGGYRGFCVE